MPIESVVLTNFRSYGKRSFRLSSGVTVVIGPNGSGKTNLLEALTVVSSGKSFRADTDKEMVRWGEELARVSVAVGDARLELLITTGFVQGRKTPTKKYLINSVPRRAIDFVGRLKTVLFWPEDLDLVTDSPSIRRKYLDRVLLQTDREYRRNLFSYERGLRQRNRLLDRIADGEAARSQLLFWDQLLIRNGSYITDSRAAYLEFVNSRHDQDLPYKVEYDKSIISESRLAQYGQEEVAARVTLVGPHRDDFNFHIGRSEDDSKSVWKDLTAYGSRGEQRLGVLWLKLAELAYVEHTAGERPLLLLDDIFSELDEENKVRIMDRVGRQQTLITSADPAVIDLFRERPVECTVLELT